jgi:exopolysaccharide biosynthesis polyprenyl glycosylphosphotransferase
VLVAGWRAAAVSAVSTIYAPHRIVLWGTGTSANQFKEYMEKEFSDSYTIVHQVEQVAGDSVEFLERLAHMLDLDNPEEISSYISEIVLVNSEGERSNDEVDALMRAYEVGITIVPMPIFYERVTRRVPVNHIRNDWQIVMPMDRQYTTRLYPALKRAMDVVLSLIVAIIFAPFFPLIAFFVKIDSPGDIFYSQERVGLNGRNFRIYKFRTMVQDAERTTGPIFAQSRDSRVTRVGKFLRKTRLDEIPQVYNVLRGEMSFVGPRPERDFHVNRLAKKIPFYRTRLRARPGLTGWAQVKYGYGANDNDARVKLEYDLYYIRHSSLKFDLVILYKTTFKILSMSGQ